MDSAAEPEFKPPSLLSLPNGLRLLFPRFLGPFAATTAAGTSHSTYIEFASLHVRFVMKGASGLRISVVTSNDGDEGSPSFFHVKAFSQNLYLVLGSEKWSGN